MQVNVAGIRRNIKNLAHNYSDAQIKVREATSNDPWGPSATIMAEVADLTYNVVAFSEIMQMIWKRLNDHGKNWRHVYKALILLEYLIKTGTEKVAQQCKENIFAIQTLREFVYFEENKDQGTHVREKARQLVTLLKDDERLKNERAKALKAKERFAQHASGFGSDGYVEGPTQRETPTGWNDAEPKTAADIEFVRPQTAGEEELQLQLAMAMSREEAEQEEAKRRSDDVRLQLALSQSEQDFKTQTKKPEEQSKQSHLMDLLDISLGATSISSPPLGVGAAGGSDPWGTPARAASQLSDPWSGTSSPQIDPWQPKMSNNITSDTWLPSNHQQRTQSPSVASGSSTEGWLQNNATPTAALNGNVTNSDPWLNKSNNQSVSAPPIDPWLSKTLSMEKPEDPWQSKTDPWAPAPNEKRPSPVGALTSPMSDMDDFDVITNRNKTGQLNNSARINNNNASLLDELDPLSTKKPLKTPQSFLGENSSLVNLDNLIKPVVANNIGSAPAYNPFSDTPTPLITQPGITIPPKNNLFQQQAPAVPSINQLKQQQSFPVTLNQDPWAPVSAANTAQYEYLIDYDFDQITVCKTPTNSSYNLLDSNININNNSNINSNININNNINNNNINNGITSSGNQTKNDQNLIGYSNNDTNCNVNPYVNAYATGYTSTYGFPYNNGYSSLNNYYNSKPNGQINNNNNNNNNINTNNNGLFGYSTSNNLFSNYFSTNGNNPNDWFPSTYSRLHNNSEHSNHIENNNMPWLKPEAVSSNPFLS